MALALQVLVAGLAAGGVYGIVAAGHSLVYRLTGVVNLAFGDLIGLGVFTTLLIAAGTGPVTQASGHGPRFLLALAVGLAVCVGAGALSYALAFQPFLARDSTIGWIAASVAIAFAIRAALSAVFARPTYVFPDPLPFRRLGHDGFVTIGGASIQVRSFFVIAVAVALAAVAGATLERTRWGYGLRAIAADRQGARIVGVPVDALVMIAFALAGGFAALAAIAAAPSGAVDVDTGALLGLKGLVAALAVRFGPPLYAMAAGLALGVAEAAIANVHVGTFELGPSYSVVVPFVFVLLLFALRPQLDAVEETRMTATLGALVGGAREAAGGWRRWHTAGLALVAAAAVLPLVSPSWVHLDAAANGLYLALAATGLWLAVGLGGMPSLGQGGFMAIGALVVSGLGARHGWPMLPAVAAGVVAAAAAGFVIGIGVVRLRPVFVGVTTWILAWTVALALVAFPSLLGGGHGVVVPSPLSVGQHYELALGLLVVAILLAASFGRGPVGIELRAARLRPAAAAALGVPIARRRLGAFVAAASVGGLAGALAVQLAGVADAADYGPALSFQLFVAVVIGGAASALGPTAGIAAIAFVTWAAGSLNSSLGVATERFDPMISGALLLVVVTTGSDGIVPELRQLLARRRERAAPVPPAEHPPVPRRAAAPATPLLTAEGLTKRYGALAAADGVALGVGAGEICALVGPNGSGKTTVLRLLGGTLAPDAGRVLLDGADLAELTPRDRALRGVVRTLQSTAAFAELTALENVLVGAGLRRVHGGALRTAAATPLARAEEVEVRDAARAALAEVGLAWAEDVPAGELAAPEQRLLGLAAALATGPRVLLLDEPSAGASQSDLARIAALLQGLREGGMAVLLVEHNLKLVRSVADRVVVMAGGSVLASGTPEAVAADPAVRAAYLGGAVL